MPLYYGHPVTQSKLKKVEVSPALKEKGIELLRAAPSQVYAFTIPFVDSPLWSSYISALSALVFSLSVGTPVSMNLAGFRVDVKHPHPLPIRYPDLCIQVTNPGPKTHEWLLDYDFEEQEIRGAQYYLLPHPSKETLNALLSSDCPVQFKDANYVPFRHTNMAGLFVFSEIVNLLSYVLQVLSVSLFTQTQDRRTLLPSHGPSRKTADEAMDDSMTGEGDLYDPTSSGTLAHAILSFFPNPSAITREPSSKLMVDAKELKSSPLWVLPSTIHTAGNLTSGIIARFVPDLCDDDSFGVPAFFSRFLRRSLGNSTVEILETFTRYKSAWGTLKSTSAGHILSHLVKTIEIAIESHCCLVAIFDGEFYEGSILQGLGFTISLQNTVVLPLLPEDLRKEIGYMDTHRYATREIQVLLAKGKVPKENIPVEIEDMDELRKCLLKGAFTDEMREKLRDLVGRLRFPIRKWSINMRSLSRLIGILAGGVDSLQKNDPIGPEAIFSNDPLEIAMSCFTPGSCPSFRHPSGVPVDLTRSKCPVPPQNVKQKRGKGVQQVNNGGWIFTVRRVNFVEAVADFRLMAEKKEARSMSSSAARGLGHFVVSGGNFERIFLGLRDCLGLVVQGGLEGSNDTGNRDVQEVDLLVALETSLEGDRKRRKLMV